MARRHLLEEGILCEDPSMVGSSESYVTRAWDCVTSAREAYLVCDWEQTDRWARSAALNATQALMFSRGLRPTRELTVYEARDYCSQDFGMMSEEIFTRVSLIGEFLPLPADLEPSQNRLMRKTVAASSELVALLESHIVVESKSSPEASR